MIGGGRSFRQFHGIERTYGIDPLIASEANRLMDDLAPLFQRVLDGASIEWDGSNHVARLTDDARDAEEEIEDEIYRAMRDRAYDSVTAWEAGYYYEGLGGLDSVAEHLGVTADTSDEEIEAIAKHELEAAREENGIYVIEDLEEYITEVRDELRDNA